MLLIPSLALPVVLLVMSLHAIACFDGNETITDRGRIQVRLSGAITLSGNAQNTTLASSAMGCYTPHMVDCHKAAHDTGDGQYPTMSDMTNRATGSAGPTNPAKITTPP